MIRAFVNCKKNNWDEQLVDFEVAYNSAISSNKLCSPFFINYGIHPRTIPMEGITSYNPSSKSFMDIVHDTTKFAYE